MLIVMKPDATEREIANVVNVSNEMGLRAHSLPGMQRTAIGITGNQGAVDSSHFEKLPGVAEAIQVRKPHQLSSLDLKPEKTVVRVGDAAIGGEELAIIAGPCLLENRAQVFSVAQTVHNGGAKFFYGGDLSTHNPLNDFRGSEEGLQILAEVRDAFGLKIIGEVSDERGLELAAKYTDIILIGSHNMQNFSLLRRAGRTPLPVVLKRGVGATLDDWLLAAEYIMAEGNYSVVLCENGIRTFNLHTLNTLDLAAIPSVRRISHLPVIVNPSSCAGKNYLVIPLACAAIAAGADGIIVETRDRLQTAAGDGSEALTPVQYDELIFKVRAIYDVIARVA
jgi:3-deoxy-7-phosphoheptulonate synthase